MTKLLSKNGAALFIAVLLLLPACIPQKRAEFDLVIKESEQDIRKGDFDGALGVYSAALQKHPGDRGLLRYYFETAEDIREAADNAFDKGEFAISGRAYAVLFRNYPHFREVNDADLSFDGKYLQARLKECSDRLSEHALTQYRQGNLSAAIALWKNILEFEPENVGVKKAIDTASTQLKNLH